MRRARSSDWGLCIAPPVVPLPALLHRLADTLSESVLTGKALPAFKVAIFLFVVKLVSAADLQRPEIPGENPTTRCSSVSRNGCR